MAVSAVRQWQLTPDHFLALSAHTAFTDTAYPLTIRSGITDEDAFEYAMIRMRRELALISDRTLPEYFAVLARPQLRLECRVVINESERSLLGAMAGGRGVLLIQDQQEPSKISLLALRRDHLISYLVEHIPWDVPAGRSDSGFPTLMTTGAVTGTGAVEVRGRGGSASISWFDLAEDGRYLVADAESGPSRLRATGGTGEDIARWLQAQVRRQVA